jgi:nucleoside-diphosphate-sugar epimerase
VPLTPYRVRSITPLWPCDCTAAHTRLGWHPRVSIREGMTLTYPPQE